MATGLIIDDSPVPTDEQKQAIEHVVTDDNRVHQAPLDDLIGAIAADDGHSALIVIASITAVTAADADDGMQRLTECAESNQHRLYACDPGVTITPGPPDPRGGDEEQENNEPPAAGDRHHGRPPLGYAVEDGHLVAGDNYPKVRRVLQRVQDGDISKRRAAATLGTSHRTINRSLSHRAAMYGLDTDDGETESPEHDRAGIASSQ